MRIRVWGARGSLATPMSNELLREKARALLAEATPEDIASPQAIERYLDRTPHSWTYGGNTSCVEVACSDATIVFDAGTGIRALGQAMIVDGRHAKGALHLCFTHFHWDHICGLPFFAPIYVPKREIDVWSGRKDADALLAAQMSGAHFPVKWNKLPSVIRTHHLDEKASAPLAGGSMRIMSLIHPDQAYGFRFERDGRSVCYLTDTEVSQNPQKVAKHYADFVEGADLVIVDAMYGFLDYHDKINFGHSTIFNFIDFFRDSNIGELVIFHHDPQASDPAVTRLHADAVRYRDLAAPNAKWQLSAARENQIWDL